MIKLKLDKKSVSIIKKKLNGMSGKLQRKAIRSTIDPEAKKLKNTFKAITPVGKRNHKNKYADKKGKGFLRKSFSVRNSGRGEVAGRSIVTTAKGYYIFMSPNETGHRAGNKHGYYYWGKVAGAKKYSRIWKARQLRITARLTQSLGLELTKL